MPRWRRTAQAEQDVEDIWLHIAQDNPAAADHLIHVLEDKLELLVRNPHLGPARPDIAPGLRFFPAGNYLVMYRLVTDGIEVVRVLHGARHLKSLL